ncbi:bifunctional demethylmenaquinone methyltransferase/2-methoxy-6-polyprenyl-1,4-benzoquinol methylase UbiE [Spirulina sp. CS-785/01]|uniref:bifunctional demethylmenaquinone methyltransferase/2-methoxy-6-polyprenyl-1,4-benzoquinol methylase UbiE n=1 Tax=Spirulina sp. CS-785/01 TaxID=3021716 RepID=UPI00232BAAA3|nr:bifunctional demethylmenaquinone methyltransferase/2-methoxy-6-polyprenyl-1,4-benzoquinol methylase UbiE [Spirulina sp. CS-785/01]MDB9315319.1 bifunctional demethylmenaquinone methyltransferase/2-methoxy-6-polyprenyl-1,4-benzoquinol methylase UbiE [Spirulina sp. CS-785/01]
MTTTYSPEQVQTLFNRIAPVYDELNHRLSWGLHQVWKQMTVKWASPQPGETALDVCCGSGDIALLLAKAVGQRGRVVGVDFAREQLAIAQKRASQFPMINCTWVEGNALELPCEDNYFNCATMGYGLRNVTDIPRSLQELHRVLKPHAKAAILDFHHPTNSLMQQFQRWYLDTIVVPTATEFNLKADYAYISPSLDRFPTGQEQVKLGYQAKFQHATHYSLAGGMMGVLLLTK